ncbi:branched-chain amino acid ABC transporter permease [Actinokineospora globicatena]|uniref:branched-chain amino acid ABC transporter permease n=1 Tax=Actinokineospora globicatena TaxID=103729 RepID=UPI0020A35110|nr:branched-chain amino acid ABC transporter permease [Actinokineospora globicatena]MCP2302806.1 branched-chain amino acid transport system permease protein [Actinokineospora globicatena]GLW78812.1 branched-chain amino acid ABC transporter permease [Actinokineospora globicatena]GLW84521.1 branched-chain amino acid ABC transporter permease [Actinokineospora globicatena]
MLQGALAGLAAGGLYAVLAVCLTLMSRLVRVVNFAQSATGMFGCYVAVHLSIQVGLPTWAGTVVGILIGGALSALLGWIISTWLAEADIGTRSAVTVAVLLLLISLSFILFGNKPQPFHPILDGPAFSVNGVVVSQVTVVTVLLSVVIAVGCRALLSKTSFGLELRALSERPTTAELMGIPAKPLAVAVWAVTGLLSTLVISIVAPSQSNDATSLSMLVVPAAAAALLGGFRRLDLAVVGGLVLGMAQGAVAQVDSLSVVRYFLPFLVIVGLLLWSQRKEVWDVAR